MNYNDIQPAVWGVTKTIELGAIGNNNTKKTIFGQYVSGVNPYRFRIRNNRQSYLSVWHPEDQSKDLHH